MADRSWNFSLSDLSIAGMEPVFRARPGSARDSCELEATTVCRDRAIVAGIDMP